jgi:hypothetical protein
MSARTVAPPRDFGAEIRSLMAQRDSARQAHAQRAIAAPTHTGLSFDPIEKVRAAGVGQDEARIDAKIKLLRQEWQAEEVDGYERDAYAARERVVALLPKVRKLAAELSVAASGVGLLTRELAQRRAGIEGRHPTARIPLLCPRTDLGQAVADELLRSLAAMADELKG